MKFCLFIVFFCLMMTYFVKAQTSIEKTEFFTGVSFHPPLSAGTLTSAGFSLAGQYNLKNGNAITATISFTPHIGFITNFIAPYNSEFSLLPILVGYKKYISKFYGEPQIGCGIFAKTVTYDGAGHEKVFTDGAFFYGAESGYKIGKRFHMFLKYHRLNSFTSTYFDKKFGYGGAGISFKLD